MISSGVIRPALVLALSLTGVAAAAEDTRADGAFPKAWTHALGSNGVLLEPPDAHTASSGVWAIGREGLVALDPLTGKVAWRQPRIERSAARLEWTDPLVISTAFVITAIDPACGAVLWGRGEVPAGAAGALTDPEDFDRYRYHAVGGGRLLSVRESGAAECVALARGEVVWSGVLEPRPATAPVFNGELLAWFGPGPDAESAISTLALATGERVQPAGIPGGVRRLLWAGNRLIVLNPQGVAVCAPATPPTHWESVVEPIAEAALVGGTDNLFLPRRDGSVGRLKLGRLEWAWKADLPTVASLAGMRLAVVDNRLLVVARKFAMTLDVRSGRVLSTVHASARGEIVDFFVHRGKLLLLTADLGESAPMVAMHAHDLETGAELPGSGRPLCALRNFRGAVLSGGVLVIQDWNDLRAWRVDESARQQPSADREKP